MEEKAVLASLAALAQPLRLRIFRTLVGAGSSGMTPGELAAALDVPASTLSFHLKELAHAGLVSQQRDGRHLVYKSSVERVSELLNYLTAHCCGLHHASFPDTPLGAQPPSLADAPPPQPVKNSPMPGRGGL